MSPLFRLRYGKPALKRDYARAGIGLAMCLAMLAIVTPGGFAFWIIIAFGLVFLAFAASTIRKHLTILDLDGEGLDVWLTWREGTFIRHQRIDFAKLDGLRLRYFGRRRDRSRGIVELTLRADRTRLTVDQGLERFDELVRRAHGAALERGLALDAATSANLAGLGYH